MSAATTTSGSPGARTGTMPARPRTAGGAAGPMPGGASTAGGTAGGAATRHVSRGRGGPRRPPGVLIDPPADAMTGVGGDLIKLVECGLDPTRQWSDLIQKPGQALERGNEVLHAMSNLRHLAGGPGADLGSNHRSRQPQCEDLLQHRLGEYADGFGNGVAHHIVNELGYETSHAQTVGNALRQTAHGIQGTSKILPMGAPRIGGLTNLVGHIAIDRGAQTGGLLREMGGNIAPGLRAGTHGIGVPGQLLEHLAQNRKMVNNPAGHPTDSTGHRIENQRDGIGNHPDTGQRALNPGALTNGLREIGNILAQTGTRPE